MEDMSCRLIFLFVVAFKMAVETAYGQHGGDTPIRIGSIVPNVPIDVYQRGDLIKAHFHDFKSRLVLLDFWDVDCAQCIAAMPKMLDLQQRFGEKIEIFIVTRNSKEEIDQLFSRLRTYKTLPNDLREAFKSLPFIVNDSALHQEFPHKVIPTHVWIDGDFKFDAIAYEHSTNYLNIQKFLAGKAVKWAIVNPVNASFDDPFVNVRKQLDGLSHQSIYSILLPHLDFGRGDNFNIGTREDSGSKVNISVSSANVSLRNLYQFVFEGRMQDFDGSRILVLSPDKTRFYPPVDSNADLQDWYNNNTYCYTLNIPIAFRGNYKEIMQRDLDRLMRLNSDVEYRNVKCFVLTPIDTNRAQGDINYDRHGNAILDEVLSRSDEKTFSGSYELFALLRAAFQHQFPDEPFLYEGQFYRRNGIIPWNYNVKKISFKDVELVLRAQGFRLEEAYRTIPMVVIKDEVGNG